MVFREFGWASWLKFGIAVFQSQRRIEVCPQQQQYYGKSRNIGEKYSCKKNMNKMAKHIFTSTLYEKYFYIWSYWIYWAEAC